MDLEVPFNYPLPEIKINDDKRHFNEAKRIIDYVKRAPNGLSLKFMILNRRDIGIEDRTVYIEALAEAIHNNFIEQIPSPTKAFTYGDDELFFRFVDVFEKEKQKARRREQLQRQLARLDDE